MYYASHFPGSLAIPMNPQTNISRYREADVQAYTRAAWGGINISEAPFCSNLNSIYASSIDHHVAYIQNLGDISHVKKYLAPLLVNLPEQSKPNVGIKLGEWGKGHKPAPGRSLVRLFRDGIACEGDWPQMFRNQNLNLNLSAEELIKKSEFYYNTMTSHSE